MSTVLLRGGLRFYARHPGHLLLTIAGIALGVAAVIAIDLAAYSARQAFEASTRLLRGQATHEITRPGGRVPDETLALLRVEMGLAAAAPVVEGRVRLAADPERNILLLGTDALSAARFGSRLSAAARGGRLAELLLMPGAVLLPDSLADELGVEAGDELQILDGPADARLKVIGILPAAEAGTYVWTDIATAQEVLGLGPGLTRIDLRLPGPPPAEFRAALEQRGLRLVSVEERVGGMEAMTRSFRINLQALSLLTLVVGAFLVFSTVSFTVVRRRATFGLLRSLGIDRRGLFILVLGETAALAAAGVTLGGLLGVVLGAGLVRLVLRTIGDLYLSSAVDYYGVSVGLLAKGVLLGLVASLAAAAIPAAEAASVSPRAGMARSDLEARLRRRLPAQIVLAMLAAALGAALLAGGPGLETAFAAIFLVLIGAALATPVVAVGLMAIAGRAGAARGNLPLAWAARSVRANLSRTGPALAALMLAVAAFVGVGLMIGSFRASVSEWLAYSLDADVLVYVTDDRRFADPAAEAELLDGLSRLPGFAGLRASRRVALPDGQGFAGLLAVGADPALGRWPQASRNRADLLRELASGDRVLVSEAFASKRGLGPGQSVVLITPSGPRDFEILDVFVDYTSDQGLVAMDLDVYRRRFDDPALSSIGLFASPGGAQKLLQAAEAFAGRTGGLRVGTSALLRRISLEVFDRTFTVTEVLRLIVGLVAVIAVFNVLQALRLDARREIGTLQALGLTPRGILVLGELQNALIGACAALCALPVGILLAWLLITVVNRIAFGWSMGFVLDGGLLLQSAGFAVAAALVAGWWPARVAARSQPVAALRGD